MFGLPFNTFVRQQSKIHIAGKDVESDLNWFLKECKSKLKNYNEQKLKKAFLICVEAHSNKVRKSGLPYYTHPLAVAEILMNEIPLDDVSVIAALLHDAMDEGDKINLKDIKQEFGTIVADIVDGVHKIDHIETQNQNFTEQAENYRKLLLSLFKDVRIILVKLADRLHNMRTIEHLSKESRLKLARESLDVYAPFANRFGLRNLKWELEDLSFKTLNYTAYEEIKSALNATREEREEYIKKLIEPIKDRLQNDEFLKKNKITFDITGRPKHIYSIFNKMKLREKSIDELYDLFAIRILIDTNDPFMCFYVYGIIASIYKPVPETFKDYISVPKKNNYQSLHTAIVGLNSKLVEMQIRTVMMHEFSENGYAAHFRYKSGKVDNLSILENEHILEWISSVRELFENAGNGSSEELIEQVKSNLFLDEIYVYTPAHEFRTLPIGSMPLDFAYDIHTEIGDHYIGAKVNSKIVPMDYKLHSGDIIEILTSKSQQPKKEWLKFAYTPKAKFYLNKYLREKEKEIEQIGRTIWAEKSKEYSVNLSVIEFEKLLKSLKFEKDTDFYIALSKQDLNIKKVFDFIKYKVRDGFKISTDSNMSSSELDEFETIDLIKFTSEKSKEELVELLIKVYGIPNQHVATGIINSILDIKNLQILSVECNDDEIKFEEILRIKASKEHKIQSISSKISKIEGVSKVEIEEL